MKVSKNVGRLDSFFRLSLGYSLLSFGIAKKSDLLIMLGSIKVAEGISRFCPSYHFLGVNTLNNELHIARAKSIGTELLKME